METKKSNLSSVSIKQFKSYYVVWKPYEVTEAKDGKYQFKSYYVVWKPYEVTEAKDGKYQFKSYYVVWKPRGNDEICGKIFCLNRTMQYGNLIYLFCHSTMYPV